MYKRLVKELHPDLNQDAGPEEIALFQQAVEAYENGDLKTIKLIQAISGGEKKRKTEKKSGLQKLKSKKKELKTLLQELEEEINEVKKSYPYILRVYLEDEQAKKERQASLESEIQYYEFAIQRLQQQIEALWEENNEI